MANYWTGKKHTLETREKMRIARLKNNPMHNPESVKKRSETLIKNKTFAGENHNNWIGGDRKYRGFGWYSAQKERREIDNYTCQDCGVKQGHRKLDVHHIVDYSLGGSNEMSNLITLCRSCHNKRRS